MKSKIIVSGFSIDLYEADITLIIGEDIETIQKYVNEKIAKVDVSDTEGCVFDITQMVDLNTILFLLEIKSITILLPMKYITWV